MKYVVTMNGKRYEVEVERMSAFHMLTREEIASGVSTPVQRVLLPPEPELLLPEPELPPSERALQPAEPGSRRRKRSPRG